MDRIQQSVKSLQHPPVNPTFSVEPALFPAPSHDTTCALFAPLHYERGYAYPLIVWLHGQNADERQLMQIMPTVSMRNYVAVAPRGACIDGAGGPDREGYGWRQSEDVVQQAEQRILDSIQVAAQKFHIDRRRIFLAGFDCGGTMAFRVALSQPGRFAGVLSLCGAFPRGCTPLSTLVEARRLPVFLAVGRDSRKYPSAEVCENLRLFHTAGLSVTLRQYPCGHELLRQMLADMDCWIMEQITSPETPTAESNHQWSSEAE